MIRRKFISALRTALVPFAVGLVVIGLLATPIGHGLARAGYDLMQLLSAPGETDLPLIIVGLDEPSFSEVGFQWPWPRGVHAQLIDNLAAAGARVIAFDVVFAEATDALEDASMAAAIADAANVVLAADHSVHSSAYADQRIEVLPLPDFRDAGARTGFASVNLESDFSVRIPPRQETAFWRQIAAAAGLRSEDIPEHARLRYIGPPHSFEYVSYYQALAPETYLPEGLFKDRIVLVGLDVKATPDVASSSRDAFSHPFLSLKNELMPGVEVHATLVENGVYGFIRALPPIGNALLVIAVLLLAWLLMRRWTPVRSLLMVTTLIVVINLVAFVAFVRYHLWLDFVHMDLAAAMLFVGLGGQSWLVEQRRKRELRSAFSRYVSPGVVSEIVASPESLRLGGVRRDLTIMFTDLAGFSVISEKTSAQDMGVLLNRYFTAMTNIVLKHRGTVDKFIGDAIMAFWGAPLSDEDQHYNACAAAIEMQQELARLRKQFAQEGLPAEIYMRVGIHSGEVLVGNLGSDDRFDYTVIGDNVNLAARLEGVNKLYGTGILVSQSTRDVVADRIELAWIDRIVVKGRSQAVDVFTPDIADERASVAEQTLEHIHAMDWSAAQASISKWLETHEDDQLMRVYSDRISEYRQKPPSPDWDGAVALEKM